MVAFLNFIQLLIVLELSLLVYCCPPRCLCYLDIVRCTNVGLTEIPRTGIRPETTALVLRGNKIRRIKQDDLKNLQNLKRLFLNDNVIQKIDPGAFFPLKNLEHLYLNGNNLKTISDYTFSGLFDLEQLYVYQNNIEHISKDAFLDLRKLKSLYLWSNRISEISRSVLRPLVNLEHLRLENNRLRCNCDLLFTVKDYVRKSSAQVVATCFKPRSKRGRILSTLTEHDLNCTVQVENEVIQDTVATPGSDVLLPCGSNNIRRPYAAWRRNGLNIPRDRRFSVKDDGLLRIQSVRHSDIGTYECVLKNGYGSIVVKVRLVLADRESIPKFIEKYDSMEAISGNAAQLRCRVDGYPRPTVIWKKEGNLVENDSRHKFLPHGDLEIMPVRPTDHGYFTCEAKNSIGSISHTTRVVVKAPPSFTRAPENLTALDGETVTLECVAAGYPPPTIAWHKDGGRLPSDGRHFVLPSGTLRILFVKEENEGTYECQAINVIGVNVVEATLTVNDRVPPKIITKPEDTTVRSGNTIFFQCKATGAPKPVISWIKNDVQVISGNRFHVNSSTGMFEIRDIGKEDEGRWECAARNSIGFASEVFELRVIGLIDGNYKGDEFVKNSVERARIEIDNAIKKTKERLATFVARTPGDLLALFRFPSPEAIKLGRAAEIFETALNFIRKQVNFESLDLDGQMSELQPNLNNLVSPEQIAMLANLSGCTAHQHPANCSNLCFHMKFRSLDSSCNNLKNPMWGAALTPFARLLSPIYENGFNTPVGWNKTEGKPSARLLSVKILSTVNVTDDDELTHMAMQWGQFLDHDITFQVTAPSSTRFSEEGGCDTKCENEHPCFPIKIPPNDPRIRRKRCMDFTRSSAVCGSGSTSVFFNVITPRQQINQITSYIDASNVYGSTEHEVTELRDLSSNRGLLKTGLRAPSGKPYPPYNTDLPIDCQVNKSESKVPCFLAGDHRANEQLGLLSMHTLWLREHNRIATELRILNPHWDSDEIFHTARKIVGAEMQHIMYDAWLPKILGDVGMRQLGNYERYNPNTDASVFNAFATAAFRFGHSLIQPFMARLNKSFMPTEHGTLPLHKAFFSPYRLIYEGGIDPLIRGLFASAAKSRLDTGQVMNKELTDRLFQMAHEIALDLAALNIQRGRDHALPGYNDWRQFCNLTSAVSFDDLAGEIKNAEIREKMKELYFHPDNVDLFVGGMVEDPIPGTRLGPVFMCLITLQFKRLRDGDRFWYENPGVFKPEQLTQMKQVSLARVICDNSDNIRHVQRDVFKRVQSHAEYQPCNSIPILDLSFWKECCSEKDSCSGKDTSFTVTNFLHERSRRSVSEAESDQDPPEVKQTSVEGFERDEDQIVIDEDGAKEVPNEENSTPDEQKAFVENEAEKAEKVQKQDVGERVEKLEDVLLNIASSINHLKKELSDIKKNLQKDVPTKLCKGENGKVKENGEFWTRHDGIFCYCETGNTKCKE